MPTSRCGPRARSEFGTRAEIKNINSFRFLQRAIEFEIERQIELLEDGGEVVQETRLYDADKDETRSMRSKEEANDYRYFPDPDLLPLEIDEAFIDAATADLPELPDAMRHRFMQQFGISDYDAGSADREPRHGGLLRDRRRRLRRRQARRQLDQRRAGRRAEQGGPGHRRQPGLAEHLAGSSPASRTTPSPARSPSRCSRPCGPAKATPIKR
jgi:hypothetical protein